MSPESRKQNFFQEQASPRYQCLNCPLKKKKFYALLNEENYENLKKYFCSKCSVFMA